MLVETAKDFPVCEKKTIPLQNGMVALVDPELYEQLNIFHWFAKKSFNCWYAVRWTTHYSKRVLVLMHRQVAQTPRHLVCHHLNGNSLDNRQLNLLNLTAFQHQKLFSWR